MPTTSSSDAAIFAACDLIHALQHPAPTAPFAQLGTDQAQALHQLATIFDRAMHPQQAHSLPATPSPRVDRPSPRVDIPSPMMTRSPPRVEDTTPVHSPNGCMIDEIMDNNYERRHGHPSPTPFGFDGCVPPPCHSPRVPTVPAQPVPPRYPTQNRLPTTLLHTANHIATISNTIHTLVAPEPDEHLPKHFAYAVVDPDTGKSLEYRHLIQQPTTKDK